MDAADKDPPVNKKRVLSTDLRQPSVRSKKAKTDSLVESILSDIAEHTPKKVDRLLEMKQKNTEDLQNLFLNAYLSAKDAPKTTQVEIEARIGSYSGSGFKSGVTKQEFDYLVRYFQSQNRGESDVIKETDFIYTSPIPEMPGNLRVTFDYEEQVAIRATIKNRTRNQTMHFGDFPYDLRLSVSSEISVPMPEILPPNYEKKRKKFRYSFINENAGSRWRVDMTKVVTVEENSEDDGKNQYATIYEVEFEVLNHTLLAFGNDYFLKDTADEFYNMLVATIQSLLKAQSDPFPDINLERIEIGDDLDQLKSHCRQCLRLNSVLNDFPGSMPVTFSRRHIPTIQKVPYYVSEKTDGIRYLMLVLENGAFFIDRKFSFNFITDFEALTELYGSQGPSLIDGELVRHTLTGKPIFMVFDVITMHNQYYGDKTLSERLQIIGKLVVNPYRVAVQEGKVPKEHPFLIMGKVFYPKEKLVSVFERIKKDEKTGHRYYIDDKRYHKTDGIIFTPDEHYNIRTTNNLFKWKYTDKLSADFRVRPTKNEAEFTFLALADTGEVECKVVLLSDRDRHQMQKDIAGHPNLKHIIGEFVYDPWTGYWKYMTLRTDKIKPNAMRVVFDTLESIAENITKEELIYRLQLTPEKDDFRQKMMALQGSLVKGIKPSGSAHPQPHPNPNPSETVIAITGGSGFIASHIIEILLKKGYKVRAIVRDLSNQDKIAHLKKLPQKENQLTFASANIEDGAYGEVLKGANILIHTATPYIYTAPDPQRDIVDPAIKGTVDAINAAIDNGVKRVVVTSSGGAVLSMPITSEITLTPNDWNQTSSLTNNPYFYSKKLAEQAAWKLWEEKKDKFELVVVNPLFVLGPVQSANLNMSLARVKSYLLNDNPQVLPGHVGVVDVRDVAAAHVIAAEHPDAVGKRIFACESVVSWKHIADTVKKEFPQYPGVNTAGIHEGVKWHVDTSILKSLGHRSFIPFEQTIKDTVNSLIANGLIAKM